MANIARNSRIDSAHSLKRSKLAALFTRSKSAAPQLQRKIKQQPFVVLYVDENCPLHGSRGKCTCASYGKNDNNGVGNDGMGSSDSLYQRHENNGSNEDLNSSSMQPFNNNPSFPNTQRDIVGNNLQFNSSSNNDWMDSENDQLAALLLYRDALKRNLTTPTKFSGGFPRMRHGRIGSQWRHIKQTNTYNGSNLMFIDGTVRVDDSLKYPITRFGYPPMKRPQHKFSNSHNDLSSLTNPATKSFDSFSWSAKDALNQRPSLSHYSNRFQQHAKDNFPYWPTDTTYKKTRSTYPNDENNDYEVKQTVQERIKPGLD